MGDGCAAAGTAALLDAAWTCAATPSASSSAERTAGARWMSPCASISTAAVRALSDSSNAARAGGEHRPCVNRMSNSAIKTEGQAK